MINKLMDKIRFQHWQIGWRKRGEDAFQMIPNPGWGWCADPFLVEYQGNIMLFAEIMLYKTERNGVLAYSVFDKKDERWGEWTVTMDQHWHLSYPNVWVDDGMLYMCPESYQMGEVVVYQLVRLPNEWKKVESYISNVEYCDSSFVMLNNKRYMFTYDRKSKAGIVFELKNGRADIREVFSTDQENDRCGGKIFCKNERIIRVAQDCKEDYGRGLIFFEIDEIEPKYKEHEIDRIYPSDIRTDCKRKFIGVHTYNSLGNIEVIDLKYNVYSLWEYFSRRRVRKVFLNKYC